jgi:hypothetical protein
MLNAQTREYDILMEACERSSDVKGLTCEIGMYMGGSSYRIMKKLKEIGAVKPHIGVDPYGNIDYVHWETRVEKNYSYTNHVKNRAAKHLYAWAEENQYPFTFINLEDTEFFKRYADGVPIYDKQKYIINSYALVFFDGPHSTKLVRDEIDFFKDRTPVGGCWVFDDIDQYPHMSQLDPYIRSLGFDPIRRGYCKISYIRVK